MRALLRDVAGLFCLEEVLALLSIAAFCAVVGMLAGMMSGAI